ncbi:MAG: penicillin-binding protein 2 [Thermodesulfatator sp.]|nr:MAG: penicillin-binding protein 2 [Thermodesulfatator sp.]
MGNGSKKPPDTKIRLKKFDQPEDDSRVKLVVYASWFLFCCFCLVGARLWYLQVMQGKYFRLLSEKNSVKSIRLQPYRGNILDRSGRLLAGVEPSFNIGIVLKDAGNIEGLLSRLEPLIDEPSMSVRMKLVAAKGQPAYLPVIIKRNADWKTVARIEARLYELPGVVVEVAPSRLYPYGKIAPHLLGYLAEVSLEQLKSERYSHAVPGDLVGKYGIEARFEQELAGESGYKRVKVDARGRMIRVVEEKMPKSGQDLTLTIDLDLQLAAEEALSDRPGAVVALDPRNGQVLVMASSPKFDPSIFANGLSREEWKALNDPLYSPLVNKAIQGQYAPGSTFKPLMAAAGLNEHVINMHSSFFCSGSMRLGRRRFRCWKKGGHGRTDLYKGLVQSCDVYFYNVGLKLGVDRISKYAFGFGLGKKTGIDLPGEKSGRVPTRKWKYRRYKEAWQKGETLNYSIGQGFLLVTPLQLSRMMAAIANGGILYRPEYVLGEPADRQGTVPVKPAILKTIRQVLAGVIEDPHGTARRCRIPGIRVGGKTGTAQVVRQVKRKQDEKMAWKFKDHALFIAFAPVDDPQIAVAVIIEHGGHGGSAAAPVARAVIERWLQLRSPKPSSFLERTASVSSMYRERPDV